MQYISINEFEEIAIKRSADINFVAKCSTPWHMLGLRAFIERFIAERSSIKGMLLVRFLTSDNESSYFIKEEDIIFPQNADVEIFYEIPGSLSSYQRITKYKSYLFDKINKERIDKTIYILQSFYQDYGLAFIFLTQTSLKCELVCIDEGVGSYRSRKDLTHYYYSKGFKRVILAWFNWIISDYLNFKLKCPQQWFTILKKVKGKWVKNDEVCKWYRIILEKREPIDIGNDQYIVVLTQPFDSDEDRKSSGAIMKALDNEIRAYQESGYKVFIKPHPRETKEIVNSYQNKGYLLFPFKGGFEKILGGLNLLPECVIGLNTTSLVTAKVLFGVRSISIIKKTKTLLTKGTKKTYNAFYGYFKNIVEF